MDSVLHTLMALLLALAGMVGHGADIAIHATDSGRGPGSEQTFDAVLDARNLPSGLTPSLSRATGDVPASYGDGCHLNAGQKQAKVCRYGDKHAATTVLLFGDSHAASWLPALDAIGKTEHWRILSLTKSACPIPRVTVSVRGTTAPDCDPWRTNALAAIKEIHPDLVVATSFDHVYAIKGKTASEFQTAWRVGMTKTLKALATRADQVILLGDSPLWRHKAPDCLRDHRSDIGACATKRSEAVFRGKITSARRAARDASVAFADTSPITCVADPCPVVVGTYLVLRDDSHLTATWSRHLASKLLSLLPRI